MNFAAFIRSIERRLMGYLRFATLNAESAEILFIQTCAELRNRWAGIADDEREVAAFDAAGAAVERFNAQRAVPQTASDSDELSRELAALTPKARETLCMNTFGPKPRESELGNRMLRQAPAPSLARQMRVSRSPSRSLAGVALSLCLTLALVAGFAALHSGEIKPVASKPPEDWLGDQIAIVLQNEPDNTYGEGALEAPATGEQLLVHGPFLDFDTLVPQKLPRGFRLESVKQTKGEESGLGFTVLALAYTNGQARLTIFEAEGGFPWRSEFAAKSARNAVSVQKYGTAVLIVSNAFMPEALVQIAADLKPPK